MPNNENLYRHCNKSDKLNECERYIYFEYGVFTKAQFRFLTIYHHPKIGRFCYLTNPDIKVKRRMKYLLDTHELIKEPRKPREPYTKRK